MDKLLRIYQCEDTMDGILTAVFEAGISGYGHRYIRIEPQRPDTVTDRELFAEYIPVATEKIKAENVLLTVRQRISTEAYEYVLRVLASDSPERGTVIYQFVTYGFSLGPKVTKAMQLPCVQQMFSIVRRVKNETAQYNEFIRFQEVSRNPSLLLAVFEPVNRILSMITPHFADRLNPEWFIIYDKTHGEAAFHSPDGRWEIRVLNEEEQEGLEHLSEQREDYVELWKTFFQSVTVEERRNSKLQRGHAPLHMRKHMTEFMESD